MNVTAVPYDVAWKQPGKGRKPAEAGPEDLSSGLSVPTRTRKVRLPTPHHCGPTSAFVGRLGPLSMVSAACRGVVTSFRYRDKYFVSDSFADSGASTSKLRPCKAGCRQQLRYIYSSWAITMNCSGDLGVWKYF